MLRLWIWFGLSQDWSVVVGHVCVFVYVCMSPLYQSNNTVINLVVNSVKMMGLSIPPWGLCALGEVGGGNGYQKCVWWVGCVGQPVAAGWVWQPLGFVFCVLEKNLNRFLTNWPTLRKKYLNLYRLRQLQCKANVFHCWVYIFTKKKLVQCGIFHFYSLLKVKLSFYYWLYNHKIKLGCFLNF